MCGADKLNSRRKITFVLPKKIYIIAFAIVEEKGLLRPNLSQIEFNSGALVMLL